MNLNTLLDNAGLNQYSLSKESGVNLSTIKSIFSKRQNIENCSYKTLKSISYVLKCSVDELVKSFYENDNISFTDFPNKNDYYRYLLKNRKNVILAFESAADYLNLSNTNQDNNVYVYSYNKLKYPFVYKKVNNFDNIDYLNIDGILVTSINQTINDLLSNKNSDIQQLLESLSHYYFSHNESFDGLVIKNENISLFNKYANEAIKYYDEEV